MHLAIRAHDLKLRGEENITAAVKAAGADGVQLVAYKCFDDVPQRPGGITPARAHEIGRAFSHAGLCIPLIGAYFNPVHPEPGKVREGMDIFSDYLRVSAALGCDTVGSETGSCGDGPWVYRPENRTEAALRRSAAAFETLCDTASEFGARVALEGASGHVCFTPKTLQRMLEMIARPNVSVIFDLYNYLDRQNCRDYFDILSEGLESFSVRIHCFHIKDCVFLPDGFKQVAVGKGELDFSRILRAIRRYDEDATLILEGTTGSDIPDAITYIRKKWSDTAL